MLVAIAIAWPAVRSFGTAIVGGTEPCATVPLAMAWTLGWGFDRVDHGFAGWWDAPIFAPLPGAFALSETMPLSIAMGWPLHAAGLSVPACHTLVLLAHLTLNGWATSRVLVGLGVQRRLATVGGLAMQTLPFVHVELGVLPFVAVWPLVWAIGTTFGLARRPTLRRALALGAALVTAYAASGQLAAFLCVALVPFAACLVRRDRVRAQLQLLAIALAVAAIVLAPLVIAQLGVLAELELERSVETVALGSAIPSNFTRAPWRGAIDLPVWPVADDPTRRAFAPAPIDLALAVLAIASALQRRRGRRLVLALTVLAIAGVVLALGTHAGPLYRIVAAFPGYTQIRSPFRAIVIVQLALTLLAVLGLHALAVRLRAARARLASAVLVVAAALMLLAELPPRPRIYAWPRPEPWVDALRDADDRASAVVLVPFGRGPGECGFEATAAFMALALEHRHPIANGYSSWFPRKSRIVDLATQLLPDARAVQRLRTAGVGWLVVQPDHPLTTAPADALAAQGLARALVDAQSGVQLIAIEPAEAR
ncbi:MAG TPA: hypothetical protein VG755_27835 [Nannocystaceae bacterium]|nr:hypothetical protein [Nannocystaceae bacterium]